MRTLFYFQNLLSSFTYKEGWTFIISQISHKSLNPSEEFFHLDLLMPVKDVHTNKPGVLRNGFCFTSSSDEDGFFEALLHIIQGMETHEIKEWFKIDGVQVLHPHPDWKGQKNVEESE